MHHLFSLGSPDAEPITGFQLTMLPRARVRRGVAFGPNWMGTAVYRTRERNLLARPTLDMYIPLSKFESIHWVSIDATV